MCKEFYKRVAKVKFNSRFSTAIHTLLIISEYSKEQKVTSDTIAELLDASPVTVRNILSSLKKAGFISAIPGKRKKGITLARPLDEIKILDVFRIVEPDYEREVFDVHNRLANRVPTGQYLNEIIYEHMTTAMEAARNVMLDTTLADILAKLLVKEAASPYENPRAFLNELVNKKV